MKTFMMNTYNTPIFMSDNINSLTTVISNVGLFNISIHES